MEYPDTRASLIVRLKDRADEEAWCEFVEVYRPLIYRLACRKGLQHADAEDLAQQVLPWFEIEARQIHSGHLPLWDSSFWCGQPLVGQMQPHTQTRFVRVDMAHALAARRDRAAMLRRLREALA